MTFDHVVTQLEEGLRRELPGPSAQAHLAPIPRREWPAGFNVARIRNAAGLLLVFPKSDRAHIVLTVRGDALRHGGQVSLPGGVVEPGESFEQAALREAHEEIALASESVRVLGALTPLDIPVSGFRLHPVVGITGSHPRMAPADGEVAQILEVAVDELLAPANFALNERERDGVALVVPAFHVEGREIWGATAMILAEFLTLLGWPGQDAR